MTNLPKLRDLVAVRTPGPWYESEFRVKNEATCEEILTVWRCKNFDPQANADALFIATMGTIADELIAVVEAAEYFASLGGDHIRGCTCAKCRLSGHIDKLESRLTAIFGGGNADR